MSILVSSAARNTNLCTLYDIKARTHREGTTDDALLASLIRGSSRAIVSFLGRELARQTYVESVIGNNRKRILLRSVPLDRDSVTLTIDDTADTDFTVESPAVGLLWREGNWSSASLSTGQDGEENIDVTYKGGYVLPGWVDGFVATAALSVADWVRPTTPVKDFLFEVTTAGTTAASEPTWPTTAAGTVTSGTVVFTARHAYELPDDLREASILTGAAWYAGGLDVMSHVARERIGDMWIEYFAPKFADPSALPRAAQWLLDPYR